jgi:CheY-like chemotaxis protein
MALKILIADDNADVREGLSLLLQLNGHAVHAVRDGEEAVAAIELLDPDVVIMDIGMPNISGLHAIAAARSEAWGRRSVFVVCSGYDTDAFRMEAARVGADHFLSKPPDMERLDSILSDVARSVQAR